MTWEFLTTSSMVLIVIYFTKGPIFKVFLTYLLYATFFTKKGPFLETYLLTQKLNVICVDSS